MASSIELEGEPLGARVLAASDLSEHGAEAIRQADRWASVAHAELDVCSVVPAPSLPREGEAPPPPEVWRKLEAEVDRVREALREQVARLTGRGPGEVRLFVEAGEPYAAIVTRATFTGCARVVVGSRNRRGLERLLLGSVAERVVRQAPCPVLVARPDSGVHRILVGTDFSEPAMPAVEAAADEGRWYGAPVTVLHCLEEPGKAAPARDRAKLARILLEDMARQLGIVGDVQVRKGSPAEQIVRAAEETGAELVVVATSGKTGLARHLLGSVAEAVVRSASCSVLVVRTLEAMPDYGEPAAPFA